MNYFKDILWNSKDIYPLQVFFFFTFFEAKYIFTVDNE